MKLCHCILLIGLIVYTLLIVQAAPQAEKKTNENKEVQEVSNKRDANLSSKDEDEGFFSLLWKGILIFPAYILSQFGLVSQNTVARLAKAFIAVAVQELKREIQK